MAKPPYGFHKNERGKIVPEPTEQQILARMRELRDAGKSYRDIEQILKEDNLCTPSGRYFHFQRIERLCKSRGIEAGICFRPKNIVREYLSGFTKDGITHLINHLVEKHMERKQNE